MLNPNPGGGVCFFGGQALHASYPAPHLNTIESLSSTGVPGWLPRGRFWAPGGKKFLFLFFGRSARFALRLYLLGLFVGLALL